MKHIYDKKVKILLLLMVAMFVSCENSDNDNKTNVSIIQPVNVADRPIIDFFNAELPDRRHSESFFYDPVAYGGSPILDNIFCVINSRQELEDIYLGEKELPEIDFDKYTLIIGQQIMPYLGFYVSKKEMVLGDYGLVFNLYARHDGKDDELRSTALQFLYYWELFPKLSQSTISFNLIKEFPNRTDIQ